MKAAVLREFSAPLELASVPEPKPSADEVLVRVRATGLCGTDLKVRSGILPTVELPLIPGHEIAGEVVEDPAGDLAAGQRVACYMYDPCGRCQLCMAGQGSLCAQLTRLGIERDGGLAEYVTLPRRNALPIGAELPFEVAAVAMDSVLTPWRALHGRAAVKAGETVLVVGAGGLGLNGVQIAHHEDARVAVLDPAPDHRQRAFELGAELCVAPDGVEEVRKWSGGGVDLALDTSGAPSGFEAAVATLRPGGRLVVCGYQPGVEYCFESSRLPLEELTLLGARAGSREEAIAALGAVEEGWLRPTVSDALPLDRVNDALERLAAGDVVGRLVITPET